MAWVYLILAGFFEIAFAISLKLMDGHKNIMWTIIFYISMVTNLYLLSLAMRTIPTGLAYAIWTGIGVAGVFIVSVAFLQEQASLSKIFFLCLLIISLVGLKISSK